MLNYKVILNPVAGQGRSKKFKKIIKESVSSSEKNIFLTRSLDDAYEKARRFALNGVDPVIACGGDGILNAVLNGVLSVSKNISIGFIPAGMSNVAANSIGIPQNVYRAIDVLKKGKTKSFDVGIIKGKDFSRYFISMVDVGPTARVVEAIETDPRTKKLLGKLSHIPVGLYEFMKKKRFFQVVSDGESYDCFQIVFSNGKFWGGDFFWDDEISIEDGMGDVFLFEKMDFFKLTRIFYKLSRKKGEIKGVNKLKTNEIQISSRKPVPYLMDGEFMGVVRNMSIKILPCFVRFITS